MAKRVYEQAQAIARRIQMERIIIDMGLVMVALGMGYWMGFRACFDYLMQELNEHKQKFTRTGRET